MAKNNQSRQRRTNQNRARREALAARTSGAAVARPSRIAPATSKRLAEEREQTKGADKSSSGSGSSRRGKASANRRERPPRLGEKPVDVESLKGNHFRKLIEVPGGMQVLLGLVLSVVVAAMTSQQKFFFVKDADVKKDKPTLTLIDHLGAPKAWTLMVLPVVAAAVAVVLGLHKHRRRVWIGASMVVFSTVVINAVMFNYVMVGGFMLWGVWKAQKVEGPQRPPRAARAKPSRKGEADNTDDLDASVALNDENELDSTAN